MIYNSGYEYHLQEYFDYELSADRNDRPIK